MKNEWGVKKEGTELWVVVIDPLSLGTEENAWVSSDDIATGVAGDLTISEGVAFAPGRPKRKPHL